MAMGLLVSHLAVDGRAVQTEIVNAGQLNLILDCQQPMRLFLTDVPVAQALQRQWLSQQRPIVEQTGGDVVDQTAFEQFLQQRLPDRLTRLTQRFAQGVQRQRLCDQVVNEAFGQYVIAVAGDQQIEGGDAGPTAVGPAA